MKSKTNKCKSCGNQFESELNKEFNKTKEVVLRVILTVFAFMIGLYIYSGLN